MARRFTNLLRAAALAGAAAGLSACVADPYGYAPGYDYGGYGSYYGGYAYRPAPTYFAPSSYYGYGYRPAPVYRPNPYWSGYRPPPPAVVPRPPYAGGGVFGRSSPAVAPPAFVPRPRPHRDGAFGHR